MSLKGIMSLNDADAWAMFQRFRWPETQGEPVCPHCACTICYDVQRPTGAPRYRCKACRKDFSPTSGTLFASHKLPIRDYLAAIALFVNAVKGISSLQLARDLGISAKTAWVLAHKLREAMAAEVKSMTIGGDGDIVEVDGCYVGGSVRQANRRADRKDRRLAMHQTGKRRVVVAARERKGRTLTAVFRREDESMSFIRARVERGTTLHTDEASTWDELRARYDVQQVNHGEAFSHDGACTNQAESLFSRFRRAEWGQYDRLSGMYLSRYASEIGWREDYRRESNGEQFERLCARASALAQSVDFTGRWQPR
jgi:transposase-like protein